MALAASLVGWEEVVERPLVAREQALATRLLLLRNLHPLMILINSHKTKHYFVSQFTFSKLIMYDSLALLLTSSLKSVFNSRSYTILRWHL